MLQEIKKIRVELDGLSQLTKNLKPISIFKTCIPVILSEECFHSYETRNSYDNLILAKAWLGKLLGELGETTPYVNDGNRKDVKDIEAAADVKGKELLDLGYKYNHSQEYMSKNHIEKVDWLREEVGKVVEEVKSLFSTELTDRFNKVKWSGIQVLNIENCYHNILTNLSEARFWFGFELQSIKENK